MDRVNITEKLTGILENYGIYQEELKPNVSFINDLGFDSLDLAELILILEETFDVSISFEHDHIHTIGELLGVIENQLKEKSLIIQK